MSKRLLREYVRRFLVSKSRLNEGPKRINRGTEYESLIRDAFVNIEERSNGRIKVTRRNSTSRTSDIGLRANDIDTGVEVKLNADAYLGSISTKNFGTLTWDGTKFVGTVQKDLPMSDVADIVLNKLNESEHLKGRMKSFFDQLGPAISLPVNLKQPLGSRAHEAVIQKKVMKQMANKGMLIDISGKEIKQLIRNKPAPNGAATSYLIIGEDNSKEVLGRVFNIGTDPLELGVSSFPDSARFFIEVRWQLGTQFTPSAWNWQDDMLYLDGSKKKSALYFTLKTKLVDMISGGSFFTNENELAEIFLGSSARISQFLGGEEMTGATSRRRSPTS